MIKLAQLCLITLCLSGAVEPQDRVLVGDGHDLLAYRTWVQVISNDLRWQHLNWPNREYALPGDVVGFRINREIQGSAIFAALDDQLVAVFVGWALPNEYVNTAPNDLRAIFYQADGTRFVSTFAAGVGHGLLFRSPEGIPMHSLVRFELYRAEDAEWAKEP
jgi:hypothetical protein